MRGKYEFKIARRMGGEAYTIVLCEVEVARLRMLLSEVGIEETVCEGGEVCWETSVGVPEVLPGFVGCAVGLVG